MNTMLLKVFVKIQNLMNREEGQDLVEYALLVSLIALGAIAATKTLSGAITGVFTSIANSIT